MGSNVLKNVIGNVEFVQQTPSDTWTIIHNLGTTAPIVNVWSDPNNTGDYEIVIPQAVQAPNDRTVVITFSSPTAGRANVF